MKKEYVYYLIYQLIDDDMEYEVEYETLETAEKAKKLVIDSYGSLLSYIDIEKVEM